MRFLTVCVVVLTLGACSQTVSVKHQSDQLNSFFSFAAAAGDFKVTVLGDTLSMPENERDRLTVLAMNEPYTWPETRFTTTPDEAADPHARMIVAFNPPVSVGDEALCRGESFTPAPDGEYLKTVSAFCYDDRPLAGIQARIPTPSNLVDPSFKDMMHRVVRALSHKDKPYKLLKED